MNGNKLFSEEQIKLANDLTEFVRRGSQLIVDANTEHIGKWRDDDFIAVEAHNEYMLWKDDAVNFLRGNHIKEWGIFSAGDSVPFVKAGLDYSDGDSVKSQRLLKNIREETTAKLIILRDIKDQIISGEYQPKILPKSKVFDETPGMFSFNLRTGELCRYPKDIFAPIPFNVGDGHYKILKTLIEEKLKGTHYVPTQELMESGEYGTVDTCRKEIGVIRTKIAGAFHVGRQEFVASMKGAGYKISDKIEIHFIPTP
jgi:hypothetical protein